MELCLETGCTSLNHYGEELCGDNVACTVNGDYTTLVLADGLGSGVKANPSISAQCCTHGSQML